MNGYGQRYPASSSPLHVRGQLVPPNAPRGTLAPPHQIAQLNPGTENTELLPGVAGAVTRRHFDVQRVIEAGGNLTNQMLHPAIIPFEQLYRRLPEEGMFDVSVSPTRPVSFELGAFTVPTTMALLLFDLRPDIYRFSGVDPGDYLPIEERRFGSIMGFDLTVDQRRTGAVAFELDPVAIIRTSQQAFVNTNTEVPSFNTSQQTIASASSFASPSGAGTGLLPQRPERYGALSIPFTIYARSRQTVQVRCIIFRPLPTPIAFIEYDIAGVLVPENWVDNMTEAIKTPQNKGEEGIR